MQSQTEWVVDVYSKGLVNDTTKVNIEPAKTFVFIWSIFENMTKQQVFSGESLVFQEYKDWLDALNYDRLKRQISNSHNLAKVESIKGDLVENIFTSFNHFHQKYQKDQTAFLDYLYNQNTKQVQKERAKFEDFMKVFNKDRIQDKMYFLFFVTKRIRNKFFHGIKKPIEVSKDHKEFEKASDYMISVVALIDEYPN